MRMVFELIYFGRLRSARSVGYSSPMSQITSLDLNVLVLIIPPKNVGDSHLKILKQNIFTISHNKVLSSLHSY